MGVKEFVSIKIGTLVNVINSGINFGIYLYLPLLIGVNSYTSFQLDNVLPSLVIVFFSPSLPYLVINRNRALLTFLMSLGLISTCLFFISSIYLTIANILWLLYGLITMNLYFNHSKVKFYIYTIFLSLLQLSFLFVYKDYFKSFLFTSLFSFVVIFIIERKTVFSLLSNIDLGFTLDVFYALLKPFFSIGFFWQVILFVISECNSEHFLSFTYYSKISLSVSVAVFSIVSMDLLRNKSINKFSIIILSVISIVSINILIGVLDYYGKNAINVNNLYASLFLFLSITPTIYFNLISDSKIYRIGFAATLILILFLIQFDINLFFTIGVGLFFISCISYYSYKRLLTFDISTSLLKSESLIKEWN
jgi:hypothetical protein